GQLANMVDNLGTQIDNLRDKFKEVDRLVDSNDGRFDRLHLAVHSVSSERPLATCLSPGRPPNISLAEHSVSTADVHGIIISV
ncbi:MAG: hypothetical protein GWP15_02805, partial [Nitrospirae bacterium]|nr:hypothetical protein [Nitrospirota bacterium]